MLSFWKTLSSRKVFDSPFLKLECDTVELPDGTTTEYIRTIKGIHSVTVIARNAKGHILVQREYSHPPGQILLQLPGGKVEGNESTSDAAVRELREESGYRPKTVGRVIN